ncbi:MAG: hypothetical protein GF381_03560 [Candidatus Pacebacteria bacterium]|nr:hypothetical protein [Candidatus Paceibacterota bacterium]
MKKFVLSFTYAVGRFTLGLLIHPYQTMQLIVEQKVFVWLALTPTFFLAITTVIWRLVVGLGLPLSYLFFSGFDQISMGLSPWLSFVSLWLVWFCVYWQVLLLYLLFRFSSLE